MKKLLLAFVVLFSALAANNVQAQNSRKTIAISFVANDFVTAQRIRASSLSSVLRTKQFEKFKEMSHGFALTYAKGATPHTSVAITLGGTFAKVPLPNKTSASDNFLLEADASGNFKMFADGVKVNPYLIAGIGASLYTNIYGAFIPLGGGFEFNVADEAMVRVQLQYRVPVTTEANAHHFQIGFGIGGLVSEKKEEVLKEVPKPADTDGDGIYDAEDDCPTTYGLAKYKGCPVPDSDKDGVNDEQDKCPQVAGLAKYNGCPVPDTDGDGVNDEEDKCVSIAGVARYQGCPVPDGDSDGINDEEDKCPTVAGTKANNGCPEVTQEAVKKMEIAAKRIFFLTGSAKLSPRSNAALGEVVKLLTEDNNLKLAIEGHTDNVGKPAFNKTLSDKRANSVKTYLVGKGIEEARLVAEGFGLEKPVATNKTAAGRTQNRRVELKLNY
ncbi:MAG TPA: OmpA family protein [Flavisolibacter sp.]|nr:OmpA family protein [Flavisolibacter sp.]